MEYADSEALPETEIEPPVAGILEPGPENDAETIPASIPDDIIADEINALPKVRILRDRTPHNLTPGRFLGAMVARVLDATPVNMHEEARRRCASVVRQPANSPS